MREDSDYTQVVRLPFGGPTLQGRPVTRCDGAEVGVEAMLRWHHPGSPLSPEAFIPVFEQSGLIGPLSLWALDETCRVAAGWHPALDVAIALPPQCLSDHDLPAALDDSLARHRLAPERLEIVVSEAILATSRVAVETVSGMRRRGVRVALAGSQSDSVELARLRDFPVSSIRLADNVVARLEVSASARSMARMLIRLAHACGLTVTACGVETVEQRGILASEGCDRVVGPVAGAPGPIDRWTTSVGSTAGATSSHRRFAQMASG
jgi:EAL domain-containing protein (putative c-di-GMP-specific phosphodiesterase class I)